MLPVCGLVVSEIQATEAFFSGVVTRAYECAIGFGPHQVAEELFGQPPFLNLDAVPLTA